METYNTQKDLFTKLPHIYLIMPFYNYAYDSVKLIRSLCHDSRDLCIKNLDVIMKMFTKQTIDLEYQRIDELTIKVLKRFDRYKLFKFKVLIDGNDNERIEMFYKMLDEMPQFEFILLTLTKRWDKKFIDTLLKKSIYETREKLFEVLKFNNFGLQVHNDIYEYLSTVSFPEKHDMS